MHYKFLHRKKDALTGRSACYLNRHPTFEIREGLYEALKPIAKKKGYRSVNQMIAKEGQTMLMQLLLEDE
jgi:hypothetical protein